MGTDFGDLRAGFPGDEFVVTMSGMEFTSAVIADGKTHRFDIGIPFFTKQQDMTTIVGLGDRCIGVHNNANGGGVSVQLQDCDGGDNQAWSYGDDLRIMGPGGKCLVPDNVKYVTPWDLKMGDCGDTSTWDYDKDTKQLEFYDGGCLDIKGGKSADGADLQVGFCGGGGSQKWSFIVDREHRLVPMLYPLRNITTDTEGNPPHVEPQDEHPMPPFLSFDDDKHNLEDIDPDLRTVGTLLPYHERDHEHEGNGLASMAAEFWFLDTVHLSVDGTPKNPLKYQPSSDFLTGGGGIFFGTYLEAKEMIAYYKHTNLIDPTRAQWNLDKYFDVLAANCTYRAFDGDAHVEEPIYYNPQQQTGGLVNYLDGNQFDDRLPKNMYINYHGVAPPADLGCVGAISLASDSLTIYNGAGKREFYALYPRVKSDGTSVMARSLGHLENLEAQLTEDDIKRADAIARALEALEDFKAWSEMLMILNYAIMVGTMGLDIVTENWTGLIMNIVMQVVFTAISEMMQQVAKHDQNMLQHAVHKSISTHPDSNFTGSRFELYNTALVYRETDGTMGFVADIQDGIKKDGKDAEARYIKKYDPDSGVLSFQTNFGPYLRTLVNGTIGQANAAYDQDDMTAGEENDYFALGLGRNFITYKKVAKDGKYTCWKNEEHRLTSAPITDRYDDPCLFGTQGLVIAHRVVDEVGIGKLQSIVVDTVTYHDGLQDSKVSYDFDTATAGHDRDAANYHQVTISPGGRGSNNGHIEQLMYNGVETNISVDCEVFDTKDKTYTDCPDGDPQRQIDSHTYRDQLRAMVYQRSIYENGKTEPQAITQTRHKVQVVKRDGFPDAVRVLPIRMDSTRDDVTSFTTYQYNAHGQKAQTDTWLNRFDHNTGKIINEGTSTSMVYAWETDAYGNSFKAANRYMDVAQTASFRLLPIAADPELEAADPTYYSIVGINGKCLDAHDAVNGTSIHIFDCEGNDNQKWSYNPDTREIKNLDGLCIDVKGGSANDNADVQVADCNGKDGQKWTPYADGEVPGQMQGIGGKCLDVLHSGTDNNTNVQLYGCNDNGSGQKWAFLSAEVAQPIVSRSDGKCLTSDGEFHNGVNVVVKDCSDSSRKWAYDPEKHGRIVAEPAGKCLDIDHHHENNANVQMYDCHDGDDKQAWVYYANTGEIKSLDYCLEVQQGGTNVQINGCAGGSNQRWEWTALPTRLVPFPVSMPDFPLADSWVPHLLGSKAHIYAQVTIDGLDDPVYLSKRSYIYQTNADEGEMPAFDPSNPAPGWIPTGETTTYDGDTGIPLVTTNVQTGMMSSRLLTHSEPRISYATFGNANAHTQEAGYIGFETYEDQTQITNFTLSGGSISTHGYSGAKAYGAGSGTVSVAVNSYNVPAGRPALLSAWVKASDGETCQLGIGQKIDTSQSGDGKTWQYLEVTADAGASASISCNSGGYIDEVLIRPADSSFGSKAHDAQYRITETTGNSGIVTHLVRDPRNRLLGSYRQDPQGRVRLSGIPHRWIQPLQRLWFRDQ